MEVMACSSSSSSSVIGGGGLRCSEQLVESPSPSTSSRPTTTGTTSRKRARGGQPQPLPSLRMPPSCSQATSLAAEQKLNSAQRPGVLAAADRAVFADERCLISLLESEDRTAVIRDYMTLTQTEIRPAMRELTCEWLLDVCREEKCDVDVYPLAVSFMDRFLSVENIFKNQLQGLASACLIIASKMKAPTPVSARRVAEYTDCSVSTSDLMSWELLVLRRLRWDVATVTAFDFVDQMMARVQLPSEVRRDCQLAVHRIQRAYEVALMPPSLQACMCLLYATLRYRNDYLTDAVERLLNNIFAVDLNLLRQYVEVVDGLMRTQWPDRLGQSGDSQQWSLEEELLTTTPDMSHLLTPLQHKMQQHQDCQWPTIQYSLTPTDIDAVVFQ